MATSGTNNFEKNFTTKLAKGVIDAFEGNRVLSKNVNTQKLDGKFNADSGDTTLFKRPTDYRSTRTATGDISGGTRNDIIRGNAQGVVQDYITVDIDYDEADEALKMGNDLSEFFGSIGRRIVTDLEVDFADFMMINSGLNAGTAGTAVTTWDHVAEAGAIMEATGVPADSAWCYGVNPFTQRKLASDQRSLGAVDSAVKAAHERAVIADNFAGMRVMTANTLPSYTTGVGADRAGTLTANPTVTYLGAKDTMTQSLAVTAFQANLVVAAGETITISGRNRLNLSTRKPVIDDTGSAIEWTGVVTASVTLDGAGAGTLVVTGPAIFEANGQYNTVDSAPLSGDVVTLGGAASTLIQPNLFWHKNAFSIGSVPIKKLHSTDTIGTTSDGLQIRCSKYADGDRNKQIVRFDLRPAYAALNPFFAGHSFG